jgi:putative ABC transport system substrate-binding protein
MAAAPSRRAGGDHPTTRTRHPSRWCGGCAPAARRACAAGDDGPVIGFLGNESLEKKLPTRRFQAFDQGLGDTGYAVGRNVAIEYRWAEGRIEQFPAIRSNYDDNLAGGR